MAVRIDFRRFKIVFLQARFEGTQIAAAAFGSALTTAPWRRRENRVCARILGARARQGADTQIGPTETSLKISIWRD